MRGDTGGESKGYGGRGGGESGNFAADQLIAHSFEVCLRYVCVLAGYLRLETSRCFEGYPKALSVLLLLWCLGP